jgi:Bax protein
MNSLPKIPLSFLVVVAASIVIFLGTRSTTDTTQIEAPTIKRVVTDIPVINPPPALALPDFGSYADVKEKKSAFFEYLLPLVRFSNQLVQVDRDRFTRVQSDPTHLKSPEAKKITRRLNFKYRIVLERFPDLSFLKELDKRIGQIPESLALAQAAKESGWGTSRFSKEANNLFGQWCFTKGCGIIPARRSEGMTHEIQKFDSVGDAIEAYVHNLNTHRAYSTLREKRYSLLKGGKSPSGSDLAVTLTEYSERGAIYGQEVASLIRYNKLEKYDSPQSI